MIWLLVTAALAAEMMFEEAVRAAAGSPAGRITEATAAADRADARGSAAWENPTVSAGHQTGQRNLEASVPIGLAPLARGVSAARTVDAVEIRERMASAVNAAAAGAAWLDARRAADRAEAAVRTQELAERLSLAAQAKVESGEWSVVEGVLAQADAARALDEALAWQQEALGARARLGVLVGAPVDELGPWPEVPVPPRADVPPAVLAADLEARAALAERLAARLALLPALEISGGWQWGEQAGPTYGASIEIPLFAPGISASRAAAARADLAEAEAELAGLDATAVRTATDAEIQAAEQLIRAWEIPGLETVLASTIRLYDTGEISITEYQVQRELAISAVGSAIDARWRLGRARLAGWELAGVTPYEERP